MKRVKWVQGEEEVRVTTTHSIFVIPELLYQLLERAVTRRVYPTYAVFFCVSHPFYDTMSLVLYEHFPSEQMIYDNRLLRHFKCESPVLSRGV